MPILWQIGSGAGLMFSCCVANNPRLVKTTQMAFTNFYNTCFTGPNPRILWSFNRYRGDAVRLGRRLRPV